MEAPRDLPFTSERRVRFHETDAMGVVHHASYLLYLEDARVDLLRELGRPYSVLRDVEQIEFAVIGVDLSYRAPLQFDDVFRVHAGLSEVRRARFSLTYLIERDGVPVLEGRTHHAALEVGTHRPVRVPEWLANALVGRPSG